MPKSASGLLRCTQEQQLAGTVSEVQHKYGPALPPRLSGRTGSGRISYAARQPYRAICQFHDTTFDWETICSRSACVLLHAPGLLLLCVLAMHVPGRLLFCVPLHLRAPGGSGLFCEAVP